jgi:hypothetical protein
MNQRETMKLNHIVQLNSLPVFYHRKRKSDPACLFFQLLRSAVSCAVFFVLTALGPGVTVADCIDPIALWKLEESGAAAEYQNELNPGHYIGVCRTVEDMAVCPEPEPARYGIGQRFYAGGELSGIDIPCSAIINWSITDSFSISFWMKRDSTPPLEENEVIVGRYSMEDGNKLHWRIGIQKTGVAHAVFITKAGAPYHWNRHLRADKILTDNRWHSIVFVRNGVTSENRLYIDGQLEDKVTIVYGDYDGFDSGSTSMNIGWISSDPKHQYKGVVDEVALYDTALSSWFVHDRYYTDARYVSNRTNPCD